jgi:hypothetical protein
MVWCRVSGTGVIRDSIQCRSRGTLSRDNADQGCSQKALAPLATFLSRYRGVLTSNLQVENRKRCSLGAARLEENFASRAETWGSK